VDNPILLKPLYSRMEVAALLGVSVQTIARMIGRGELQTIKVGERFLRIPAESLARVIGEKGGAK
jgi:excisionase family DNA binding protein